MEQRLARGIEGDEFTTRTAARRAHFGNVPRATDRRHAVTCAAAGAVERRTQPFIRSLDFEEIVQAKPELLELHGCYAWQRVAGHAARALRHEQSTEKDDGGHGQVRSVRLQPDPTNKLRHEQPRYSVAMMTPRMKA